MKVETTIKGTKIWSGVTPPDTSAGSGKWGRIVQLLIPGKAIELKGKYDYACLGAALKKAGFGIQSWVDAETGKKFATRLEKKKRKYTKRKK